MSDAALSLDEQFGVHYRMADSILGHPHFSAARTLYLQRMCGLYGEDPFHNKLLMEAGRMVMFCIIICLRAAYEPERRETWPTLANLKRVMEMFGLASPRHTEQVIQRLIEVGYLEQEIPSVDSRVRLLLPTGAMLAHDQDWLIAHYAPLDALYPQGGYDLPLRRDVGFQYAQRQVAVAFFPRSATVLLSNPAIQFFGMRDAGFLILAQLALEAGQQDDGAAPCSYQDLGERFAVSRTHVRQLLSDAQAQGLVALHGRGGQSVALLPPLWQALDRFIADGMSGHDLTGRLAAAKLAAMADVAN